jgi:hypothetical protein
MDQTTRNYPELARLTDRFTMSTRGRLARALVHALTGRRFGSPSLLHDAVGDASLELRSQGLDDRAVLAFFSVLVADTGRACGADRPSLLSGEPRWLPVRGRVLALAGAALSVPCAST